MNVVTSLLGLVIVSHLSPKGSGRFNVQCIQRNLKVAQSSQKSYADQRRQPLVLKVGDYVYLKVSPMKGVTRFGVKGKLAPRYIGPFPVLE
jgi:hypothetical protein